MGTVTRYRHTPLQRLRDGFFWLVVAAICFGFAIWTGSTSYEYVTEGLRTEGVVKGFKKSRDKEGTIMYRAVVDFRDKKGRLIRVYDSLSSSEKEYELKEKLELCYFAEEPTKAEINRFWPMWGTPFILSLMGLAFSFGTFWIWTGRSYSSTTTT